MKIVGKHDMNAWYQLINAAKDHCGYDFADGVDHYLVLTLDAFLRDTDLANNVLALTYLENIREESFESTRNLRLIGDQCLLISGLFPERANKRNVSLGYYVDMGKNSYYKLANASPHLKLNNDLFYELSIHFVGLMDILTALRHQHFSDIDKIN